MPSNDSTSDSPGKARAVGEVILLVTLFFIYAGDLAPMVNEAHYLVKAKNFWQPQWCQHDLFAASGKAHTTFYTLFGWPTLFCSLDVTAWIGRIVGWTLLAVGLQRLCWVLLRARFASLGVAVIWIAGIEHANLAGEWVVGGIEAKVPAYGLILLAMAELAQRHWARVWPLLGAASAFHVLSGGWSVIAAMAAWWVTERGRDDRVPLLGPALFLGGAISLLGLVPALALTFGANAEDATAAARIYAYYRIKHHLLPADFLPWWYLRHGLLIAATAAIARFALPRPDVWNRVIWFTVGAVAIAAAGLAVGMLPPVMPDFAARLLRYYWFRLTDAMVPLLFGLLVVRLVIGNLSQRSVGLMVLAISVLLVAQTSYTKTTLGVPPSASNTLLGWDVDASAEKQQRAFADWQAVCRWARRSSDPNEIFLTPRHQQTFKWYAHRAEVVNWKDVPQDAESLREWYRRFRQVFPRRLGTVRVTIRYSALKELREEYGVRYLIVDQRVSGKNLPLVKVYPTTFEENETYAAYLLP